MSLSNVLLIKHESNDPEIVLICNNKNALFMLKQAFQDAMKRPITLSPSNEYNVRSNISITCDVSNHWNTDHKLKNINENLQEFIWTGTLDYWCYVTELIQVIIDRESQSGCHQYLASGAYDDASLIVSFKEYSLDDNLFIG